MRRVVLGAAAALAIPGGIAEAKAPTAQHRRAYERAYHRVAHQLGKRTPGRNIVRWGLAGRRRLTDARVERSIVVLHRELAPAPQAQLNSGGVDHPLFVAGDPPQLDALAQCVERNESGGDPGATNGQYHGIGQWSDSAWAAMGGTKYAPTPLEASKAQQEAVLASESDATLADQQGQYDGCSRELG